MTDEARTESRRLYQAFCDERRKMIRFAAMHREATDRLNKSYRHFGDPAETLAAVVDAGRLCIVLEGCLNRVAERWAEYQGFSE